MPQFATIGYGDQEGYDHTPLAVRVAAHANDSKLQTAGAVMGVAGAPIQVRNPDAAEVKTAAGPYIRSPLPVAGFAIIEASDLGEAVKMVSKRPCAVAHGVMEVWPLQQ